MRACLRRRRPWLLGGLALLLSALLGLPAWSGISPVPAAGSAAAPAAREGTGQRFSAGSYEQAKVRILGIPALTVAAPVVGDQGDAPDASRRALVIEGNLDLLYDPTTLCSDGEWIAEGILLQVLGAPQDRACVNSPLQERRQRNPAVAVNRRRLPGGEVVLEAVVPERSEPLPLLTVTYADAALNGTNAWDLAERWRRRLESRLLYARQATGPEAITRRWRTLVALQLVVLAFTVLTFWLWRRNRRRLSSAPSRHHRHLLGQLLLVLVLVELTALVALGVMAVPGKVPLGLELLFQPLLGGLKFLILGAVALLGRSLATFLLNQWADGARVAVEEQARREQRHRSLVRVTHRLIDLASLILAGLWILIDIPGVRQASASLLLAGGALLGGLAIVFQGLLRDFAAGLAVLIEDRYAIGDWVEIGGLAGDVVDVGVLSTQLRCLDQRVAVIQNSAFDRVVNHTKLHSGMEVTLLVSHRCTAIDRALAVVAEELEAFRVDANWGPRLLAPPLLRGVSATGPLGITVSILLTTVAGEQWACSRELRRRLVARFQQEGIPLADGLELAGRS
ncbi:mechanosensitive ion channel domain-containing protein [Synechococcus sp. CCY 0621]|uniref:mechanosensitive ion channel family protein n=1 Tax=Synechococcus sp. CCY 0621 TaxID=2815603 RepID=UPI001C2480E4|nr:mechanosensitive ion channel domain-containing protein [Synechococcus sp. CCY 0621]